MTEVKDVEKLMKKIILLLSANTLIFFIFLGMFHPVYLLIILTVELIYSWLG